MKLRLLHKRFGPRYCVYCGKPIRVYNIKPLHTYYDPTTGKAETRQFTVTLMCSSIPLTKTLNRLFGVNRNHYCNKDILAEETTDSSEGVVYEVDS